MRYYRSSLAIIFCDFRFFDNFLRLEKLAQTCYTEFLINTKLQNNKSNKEILLIVYTLFVFKITTVNFRLKLAVYNSYFFMIFILSCCFLLFILKRCVPKGVGRKIF